VSALCRAGGGANQCQVGSIKINCHTGNIFFKKKKPLTSVVEFTSMYGLKEVEGK
jgi:hypothetical protein